MELKTTNILLIILTIASFIWSVISKEFRILAIILGFIILVLLLISEQNDKIRESLFEQNKIKEKLKIHEQLIDIKADIKYLQKGINKNGKK